MSLYQLHRCVYDFVRAGGVNSSAPSAAFDASRYDLSDDERKAFEAKDVAALYQLGVHAVLLNGYCRAIGLVRDQYRKVLEPFGAPEERTARWQK